MENSAYFSQQYIYRTESGFKLGVAKIEWIYVDKRKEGSGMFGYEGFYIERKKCHR